MAHTLPTFAESSPLIVPIPCVGGDTIERFAFPEIPESSAARRSADDRARVIWPESADSKMARAYAELTETIRQRLPAGNSLVLAITSPTDGDGKTSVVVELSRELATRTRGGVLVADADLRGGGLSRRLNVARIPGSGTIGGAATIWTTSVPRLSAALVSPRPQSQGSGAHWSDANLIASLRERWPLVLLDCPSLEHADTAPVLSHCDGVYLVVRLGHTSRCAVAEAGHIIQACGSQLLGAVVVA